MGTPFAARGRACASRTRRFAGGIGIGMGTGAAAGSRNCVATAETGGTRRRSAAAVQADMPSFHCSAAAAFQIPTTREPNFQFL